MEQTKVKSCDRRHRGFSINTGDLPIDPTRGKIIHAHYRYFYQFAVLADLSHYPPICQSNNLHQQISNLWTDDSS
jgi:hypothetical protein